MQQRPNLLAGSSGATDEFKRKPILVASPKIVKSKNRKDRCVCGKVWSGWACGKPSELILRNLRPGICGSDSRPLHPTLYHSKERRYMAITHKYTLVCDDVRQENTGKFIVIGLYTPNIGVPQLPFAFPFLTFFVCLESDHPGNFALRIRIESAETGQRLIEGMGMMGFRNVGIGAMPIRFGPIQFQNQGSYNFCMEVDGEREPIVVPFVVNLNLLQPQAG